MTAVCSAFCDGTGNFKFLTSVWLCSCLGAIYRHMSGSFKSRKILPKLDGSVVPVRETQPLSPENCTISVCRDVTQTCFTRGRKRLKLCRNLQTACCRFCYSSPCGFLLTETCMLKSFFVLSPTQPFSVSRGMSVENSLNSGM